MAKGLGHQGSDAYTVAEELHQAESEAWGIFPAQIIHVLRNLQFVVPGLEGTVCHLLLAL